MIVFETQEQFEKAVMDIIREKVRLSARTSMDNYYTHDVTVHLSLEVDEESASTCYFET